MQYRYQEELEAGDLVSELAVQMLDQYGYGPYVLQGPFLLWDWRPDHILQVLSSLVPHNMRIDLLSSSLGPGRDRAAKPSQADGAKSELAMADSAFSSLCGTPSTPAITEPHFGTTYWSERLPDSCLDRWLGVAADHPALALPTPNPFIPKDLSLRELEPVQSEAGSEARMRDRLRGGKEAEIHEELKSLYESLADNPEPAFPILIHENQSINVWHLQDRVFRHPRTAVYMKLASPAAYHSPRTEALTELLVRLVRDSLNETTYLASIAELYYSLKCTELGLELHFHGFSHRLACLVELVLTRLLCFTSHLSESRFQVQKEALLRHYANDDIKPGRLSRTLRLSVIKERMWTSEDLSQATEGLRLGDLQTFIPDLLGALHLDVLIHGNCNRADVTAMVDLITSTLKSSQVLPLPFEDYPQNLVMRLPEGYNLSLVTRSKVDSEKNSAVEAYWQVSSLAEWQ